MTLFNLTHSYNLSVLTESVVFELQSLILDTWENASSMQAWSLHDASADAERSSPR